jgi:poly-beta-1,6-N-acetyl-D-glucosamine synthase
MSPPVASDARPVPTLPITVGLCAYNEARTIAASLSSVLSQSLSDGVELLEVIVVASGCTDDTEAIVRSVSSLDPRVNLVHEATRTGKASALNKILSISRGELIVFTNGDAVLEEGALAALVDTFRRWPAVEVACGAPVVVARRGDLVTPAARLLWRLHNRTLQALSDQSGPNHCCDELFVVRRGVIDGFPPGIINDGAYLGALMAHRNRSVRFVSSARVRVRVPSSAGGLLLQRRRILRGHRQVKESLGLSVNTLESLARRDPAFVGGLVARELLSWPASWLVFGLLLLPLELLAHASISFDRFRSFAYQPVWPVVE